MMQSQHIACAPNFTFQDARCNWFTRHWCLVLTHLSQQRLADATRRLLKPVRFNFSLVCHKHLVTPPAPIRMR